MDLKLIIPPDVFNPATCETSSTSLLAKQFASKGRIEGKTVLDLGTGSGVLGILAANLELPKSYAPTFRAKPLHALKKTLH